MTRTVIKIENLSKQYRLGLVGTGTISHDLNRWWARIRGKEDPFLKIGEANDRSTKANSSYVWSLKDINFSVKEGEVLGIIGKNGAGKSTLLKILSKVTGPTTGRITAEGRIGALLEVGTGFHPELTGRENIFLNGAILGMTKNEIKVKLDEIVSFSGCERYIDTPVKRYSSGMKVRLAFAVAAFLEPEILIIDEVLAVGDAEFQKKAIGKIQDVSKGDGRTVLFVSHNMGAIESLCTRAILLEHGKVKFDGNTDEAINQYLEKNFEKPSLSSKYLRAIETKDSSGLSVNSFAMGESIDLKLLIEGLHEFDGVHVGFFIKNDVDEKIGAFSTAMYDTVLTNHFQKENVVFRLKNQNLIPGFYSIDVSIAYKTGGRLEFIPDAIQFDVLSSDIYNTGTYLNKHFGKVFFKGEVAVTEVH